MTRTHHIIVLTLLATTWISTAAQAQFDYEAAVTMGAGDGHFAPHYIMAGRGGTVTAPRSAQASVAAWHTMDTTRRVSWGAGAEVWVGAQLATAYDRYDTDKATTVAIDRRPAHAWIEQAWVEGKHRSVFLTLGMKREVSPWLDTELSSGDLIMSGNARPGTGFRTGFINPQNIPFLKGWVQIAGEVGYYRLSDGDWLNDHYNRVNHFVTTGYWFHYKNIAFSSPAHYPFQLILGGQAASQFGGTAHYYTAGVETATVKMKSDAKAFFRAIVAGSGGTAAGDYFAEGNHVGSWDIVARYRFTSGTTLRAYHQTIWEDGSGVGLQNGFDGLWGLEYKAGHRSIVSGAVVEYIDLTNQSGPIHWAPADAVHDDGTPTSLTRQTTGSDDYYNNYIFNGYQNHGLSIGSPMVRGTIYNVDGFMMYTDNMMRGFHVAVKGEMGNSWAYRLMGGYRRSWGTPARPRLKAVDATSAMMEVSYTPPRLPALAVKAQVALDRGALTGDNTGALLTLSYHGNFTLGKR